MITMSINFLVRYLDIIPILASVIPLPQSMENQYTDQDFAWDVWLMQR